MDFPVKQLTDAQAGHDLSAAPDFNGLGIGLICFIILHTALLLWATWQIWRRTRISNGIRIRGFWITFFAVFTIDIYVVALFIVYPLNGDFLCGTEFWIMNTIFPLGIAMFQVSNVRLLAYSKRQNDMLELKCFSEKKPQLKLTPRGFWAWLRSGDFVRNTYVFIGVFLCIQLIVTLVLYYGSRRFHDDSGFFGPRADPLTCRKGVEWIPSILWQFIWAWLLGPWVLYRTRGVKDTHYWGLQTRIAVFSGLPGTPLWLAFLYRPNVTMVRINTWWPPAMWFAPGLIVMQFCCLGFSWLDMQAGKKRKASSVSSSGSSTISRASSPESVASRKSQELANSYEAFEHHLRFSLRPLLVFSVSCDFTSENVLFLREVRTFKTKWRRNIRLGPLVGHCFSNQDEIEMYEDAARIFFELVDPDTARICINVASKTADDLKAKFRYLSYEPPTASTSKGKSTSRTRIGNVKRSSSRKRTKEAFRRAVAPWESPSAAAVRPSTSSAGATRPGTGESDETGSSETQLIDIALSPSLDDSSERYLLELPEPLVAAPQTPLTKHYNDLYSMTALPDAASLPTPPRGTIKRSNVMVMHAAHSTTAGYVPASFNLHIFDEAERSVKRDVYYNTWKSYIKSLSHEDLSSLSVNPLSGDFIPRRKGQGGFSHMTDVEMYDLELEMQEKTHHGALDAHLGPVAIDKVDVRCAACRRKEKRRFNDLFPGEAGDVRVESSCLSSNTMTTPTSCGFDGATDDASEIACCSGGHYSDLADKKVTAHDFAIAVDDDIKNHLSQHNEDDKS